MIQTWLRQKVNVLDQVKKATLRLIWVLLFAGDRHSSQLNFFVFHFWTYYMPGQFLMRQWWFRESRTEIKCKVSQSGAHDHFVIVPKAIVEFWQHTLSQNISFIGIEANNINENIFFKFFFLMPLFSFNLTVHRIFLVKSNFPFTPFKYLTALSYPSQVIWPCTQSKLKVRRNGFT